MYDKVIIGAGLYGLYAAKKSIDKGEKVVILEKDNACFTRATYINQARVHMGYHYPRSLNTATKSANYFHRFLEDYSFCIHKSFDQIYATSKDFSWTNREQFMAFCDAAGIYHNEVPTGLYFNEGLCDGAFLTEEYTYDAMVLRDYFLDYFKSHSGVEFKYGVEITEISAQASTYVVSYVKDGHEESCEAPFVLNATYSGVNQIIGKVKGNDSGLFKIKYELCEIILVEPSDKLKNVGITVMDGPFFSIMPFGLTGLHSLTSVAFTPHTTSYDSIPTFDCQKKAGCKPESLSNCNLCQYRPESAWTYMSHLANKYIKPEYEYRYKESLFSIKPILTASEIDDSRPTQVKVLSKEPTFISVLSGKINTVYDLDEYL